MTLIEWFAEIEEPSERARILALAAEMRKVTPEVLPLPVTPELPISSVRRKKEDIVVEELARAIAAAGDPVVHYYGSIPSLTVSLEKG